MDKREFLRALGNASFGSLFAPGLLQRYADLPSTTLARHDEFWDELRARYRLSTDYINLENGYYSMQSQDVLDAFIAHVRTVNFAASRYMRTQKDDDKLRVRARLARMAGCGVDELVITRNTTESLDTVIAGFDWKPGDEAVMAAQDYGAMLAMFDLQARRYGMVNRVVSLPNDPRSDQEIVDLYAAAITPKTRLLMICHVVNITGQILPVRAICDMAHDRGVEVMVDGAHAFAQLTFHIPDLNCDYYGASLHKWLGAPLGAGILYVRRDRIAKLWPIYGEEGVADDDITKLNHTGTHPAHTDLGIDDAIDFHEAIGSERKEARLRHLQQYWMTRVRELPNLVINTPKDPARSCAIANVGLTTMEPTALASALMERYRVWTVAIDRPGVRGVRVTPHVFTTTAELDVLVRALKELAAA
jgi:selenocysteine lyase/cysteine desulfurase